MTEPPRPNRQSLRLQHYDYASPGAYFVTLCVADRACLFGDVSNDTVDLSALGKIVQEEWLHSAKVRAEITLREFVIMPNHFHGIVTIADPGRGKRRSPEPANPEHLTTHDGQAAARPYGLKPRSLGALVAGFKSASTRRINAVRLTPGAVVWQRNYYEHVIRDEADYARIAEYVTHNPLRWAEDSLHPRAIGSS